MALVLVQHDISGQIVELDEVHLAHPVLGPHYKRVRVNKNGKVFVLDPLVPDVDFDEDEETAGDAAEVDAPDNHGKDEK